MVYDLAAICGVSRRTVYRWSEQPVPVPEISPGRYDAQEVAQWMEDGHRGAPGHGNDYRPEGKGPFVPREGSVLASPADVFDHTQEVVFTDDVDPEADDPTALNRVPGYVLKTAADLDRRAASALIILHNQRFSPLDVNQMAAVFHVGPQTITAWTQRKPHPLPHHRRKGSRKLWFPITAVIDWIRRGHAPVPKGG